MGGNAENRQNTFLVMVFFISSLVFQNQFASQMQILGDDGAENTFPDPTMTQFIITACITHSELESIVDRSSNTFTHSSNREMT